MKLLHVHGQKHEHGDVFLVGNVEALTELQEQIKLALQENTGAIMSAMATDGEGYNIVIKVDNSFWGEDWSRFALPYTDEISVENRDDVIWPWELPIVSKGTKS